MSCKCIVFDLDDTLTYEIDFLKSAYREIASSLSSEKYDVMIEKYQNGENVFEYLESKYGVDKNELLNQYRNHFPTIKLIEGAIEILEFCRQKGYFLGLITDGRSITQRNKIKALEIEDLFDKIIISEEFGTMKPNEKNYKIFEDFSTEQYFYIGDNVKKDFITPNRLGWTTICLLNQGQNIHHQNFEEYEQEYQPQIKIKKLTELLEIL